MKLVLALDSFKGSLTAAAACGLVAAEFRRMHPDWVLSVLPMADGGEGTAQALVTAAGGRLVRARPTHGPLPGQRVAAGYGWIPRSRLAIVETAAASGLPLLRIAQRDPLHTTTYGTGELLLRARCRRPRRILLGLGGSATVDGGTGAASALGWRFLDRRGRELPAGGGALLRLARIVPPARRRPWPAVDALCDVRNPLCGPHGAAAVFGPQKGATPAMVSCLDDGLAALAERLRLDLGTAVGDVPGAGAAGGFGAGAVAFLGARLVRGIEAVAAAAGLPEQLLGADWLVTGEGRFDCQSLQGKVVGGVCELAARAGVRVAVLAGQVALGEDEWRRAGISIALASARPGMPVAAALRQAPALLAERARELAAAIVAAAGSARVGQRRRPDGS